MRRLEGVIDGSMLADADSLKKYSLFFDKLHLIKVYGLQRLYDMMHTSGLRDPNRAEAEFDYLQEQGFIAAIDDTAYLDFMRMMKTSDELERWMEFVQWNRKVANALSEEFGPKSSGKRPEDRLKKPELSESLSDCYVRITSLGLTKKNGDIDIVPICRGEPQDGMLKDVDRKQTVWKVALEQFPTPGPTSSWEDVLNFKADMHDKEWHFRRLLRSLTTTKQTGAEIRDHIEWMLNEYTKAMEIHHLKARNGFAEVYVNTLDRARRGLSKVQLVQDRQGCLVSKEEAA